VTVNDYIFSTRGGELMVLEVTELSDEKFQAYGLTLKPNTSSDLMTFVTNELDFYILFREQGETWQVGYYVGYATSIDYVERHPNTPEVFVPLSGAPILVVLKNFNSQEIPIAFRLDKPVVINRGVWHNVISVSGKSEILIIESMGVVDEQKKLPFDLTVLSL